MIGLKTAMIGWLALATLFLAASASAGPPKVGQIFPAMELPTPANSAARRYLGIDHEGKFRLSDVKARFIIVEIFSLYCPYCQREAPNVNRLFQLAEGRPEKDIKIIGIGVGNSRFEVKIFRDRYHIAFPLIPDGDYQLHKRLGGTRTPYFIVVSKTDDHADRIIYSKPGSIGSPEAFLQKILRR